VGCSVSYFHPAAHPNPQARDDVVTRHTRFSTKAPLDTVLASIESAAVGSGGRVERQEEGRWAGLCTQCEVGRVLAWGVRTCARLAQLGLGAWREQGSLLLPCGAVLPTCRAVLLPSALAACRMRLYIPQPRSGTMQVRHAC